MVPKIEGKDVPKTHRTRELAQPRLLSRHSDGGSDFRLSHFICEKPIGKKLNENPCTTNTVFCAPSDTRIGLITGRAWRPSVASAGRGVINKKLRADVSCMRSSPVSVIRSPDSGRRLRWTCCLVFAGLLFFAHYLRYRKKSKSQETTLGCACVLYLLLNGSPDRIWPWARSVWLGVASRPLQALCNRD